MPLAALLAWASLGTVLVAQAVLACSRHVSIPMPEMPGMTMAAMPMIPGAISVCPIVIALGAICGILSLNALRLLRVGPDRKSAGRNAARLIVRLPFWGACGIFFAFSCGTVGLMMAIDGTAPGSDAGWLSLGGIVLATAIATALIAIALANLVLTLSCCVRIALLHEMRVMRSRPCSQLQRAQRNAHPQNRPPILAACRGLRAPPLLVR